MSLMRLKCAHVYGIIIVMKFMHLSDLHLGKRVNEFSMIEEQEYILSKIADIARDERPEAVIIAGDVYDKPVPPVEAIKLFDGFLNSLTSLGINVLVISGNHDSAERLSFGSDLLGGSGVFIAHAYGGGLAPVTFNDGFGRVNFYLLPFIKPANVARVFPDETVQSYTDAVRVALSHANVNFAERNVLVTHQFVTGAVRSESEEISVGGTDNVDLSAFGAFDYVALGHIHRPQNVAPFARYCGTPLKYSFSEASHQKSVTIVEMGKKGDVTMREVDLAPRRDWIVIRGSYAEVTAKSFVSKQNRDNFFKVVLTDEEDIPDGAAKLRIFYPGLMVLEYDNARTRAEADLGEAGDVQSKTPEQLFAELYEKQNGKPMTEEMRAYVGALIQKIWEGEA